MSLPALPIDPRLPELLARLAESPGLVLTAEPGAGKTTRVPRALLDDPRISGEILVLEPRRLAARLAAERVAFELGERVGQRVGFQTRFERALSRDTRVRFLTEGILTRRLLSDPTLDGVGVVVLDELHERHLATDVALALLRRLQRTRRPDLKLVAMSATLDAEAVAAFLGAEAVHAEGRTFPVEVEHAERRDDRPLASRVTSALFDLLSAGLDGHVLVFLPGSREIHLALEACRKLADTHDLDLLPLHGSLSVAEQDRAVRPSVRRKVVMATNVAETSVTIDGVVAVVDSGLALVASHAPWSGMPVLKLGPVSRAAATQRAGRAGRTRPGRCVRLYTKGDFLARPAYEAPEIARLDLSEPVLEVVAHGVADPLGFGWFEPPPTAGLDGAIELLTQLGAIERSDGGLATTPTGRRMLTFPVHPRAGRLLVEAERRGVARDGCALAAIVAERGFADAASARAGAERSDLLALLGELDDAEHASPEACRARGIDKARAASATRTRKQLERAMDTSVAPPRSPRAYEDALLVSVLAGFPDRVARLREPDVRTGRAAREVVFAGGGSAALAPSSRVRGVDLVVAVDAEERVEQGRTRPTVRLASGIEADWLLELFTDRVVDEEVVTLPPGSRRVEAVRRLRFGSIVLEESRSRPTDEAQVADVLARALLARGLPADAHDALAELSARVALVRAHAPETGIGASITGDLEGLVRAAVRGRSSLDDFDGVDWSELATAWLSGTDARLLAELAPTRVTLPGGRGVRVTYAGGAPWVASRLQDFFGLGRGPAVVRGRVPLVLHLLAPNQRAVQLTTDLAGFWQRHYPAIAKELRRKYPRHAWPDDPRTASPPAVVRRDGGR
jgi:ATP-dependent helicase HrpB